MPTKATATSVENLTLNTVLDLALSIIAITPTAIDANASPKLTTISIAVHQCGIASRNLMQARNSPFFEIALVLVGFDHVASFIVNANHSIV